VIRGLVNSCLLIFSVFDALYSPFGRGSIPPERLIQAPFLEVFYSICSEQQLVELIEFVLLFRWFVGLGADNPIWDATTFSKKRDQFLEAWANTKSFWSKDGSGSPPDVGRNGGRNFHSFEIIMIMLINTVMRGPGSSTNHGASCPSKRANEYCAAGSGMNLCCGA